MTIATRDFDQFKAVVIGNQELMENFRRITHYPEGQFFASPNDAVGYLKEEVFHDMDRTLRLFKEFQNFYRGDT
jgi:hypothetical protein